MPAVDICSQDGPGEQLEDEAASDPESEAPEPILPPHQLLPDEAMLSELILSKEQEEVPQEKEPADWHSSVPQTSTLQRHRVALCGTTGFRDKRLNI